MSNELRKTVNLGRHKRNCSICAHKEREQIDADFTACRRNVRAALERIIEKAGEVEVTSSAVVAAVQALTKINAQGQWVERSEHVNLNELFDRMSKDELEAYAREGSLPEWFTRTLPATAGHSQGDRNDE